MTNTKNAHYLTLGQAAKAVGKSKSVISNALKKGDISYISKDDSGYKIDPSELFRVFSKNATEPGNKEPLRTQENDIENTLKIKELEFKLEATIQERNFLKEQYAKIENDRDEWRTQAQRLAITHQKPVETPYVTPTTLTAKNHLSLPSGQILVVIVLVLLAVVLALLWPDITARLNGSVSR